MTRFPNPRRIAPFASLVFFAAVAGASANDKVHVSRFWHNHQPTYWPEWNTTGVTNPLPPATNQTKISPFLYF